MLLLKKEPDTDPYRLHYYSLDAPISKGKLRGNNKGYDPEVRRARYLRKKSEKLKRGQNE